MGKYRTSGYYNNSILFILFCIILFGIFPSEVKSSIQSNETNNSLIISESNCTPSSVSQFPEDIFTQEERLNGALILHFIGSIYIFYALFIVCDEYFVPSIEEITKEYKISTDLAGATIMAISTSAPELFTNIIGTFVTKGDMGVGTIVGSAVFNILAVGAACGIGAGFAFKKGKRPSIKVDWYPLSRDCFFYMCSVCLLLLVLANRRIYWYEALTLLLFYSVYILVMCNNELFRGWIEGIIVYINKPKINIKQRIKSIPGESEWEGFWNEKSPLIPTTLITSYVDDTKNKNNIPSSSSSSSSSIISITESSTEEPSSEEEEIKLRKILIRTESRCQEVEDEYGFFGFPTNNNIIEIILWLIPLPLYIIFKLTIPDCRLEKWRRWYFCTLLLCVIWIGCLTYIVSWMINIIGETLNIPESVTGLTFLAAGTSIPEVISSVIVARQGFGSMGLSNSIGSNTFDLLFCLGFPWLIECILLIGTDKPYVEIHSSGLEISVGLLITSIILFYIIISFNNYKLDWIIGSCCIIMYGIFLPIAILLELNFFFPVNLPSC